MQKIELCQICGGNKFSLFMECPDHFLTKEIFTIMQCDTCKFRFTNPRPEEKELGKYYESEQYVSHSGNKKGVINSIYQIVKQYTLSKKFLLVNRLSKGKTILDIGCATGEFLNLFKQKNWKTIGIEPNEKARNFAISQYSLDAQDETYITKIEEKSIDVITMWHVLEHISNLDELLNNISRMMKVNGILIIAVPNHYSFDSQYYKEYWAGYDVPRHLSHFDQDNIKQLMNNYGFSCLETIPMKFDSYYVSMLSEKYKNGKTNLLKSFLIGLKSNWNALKGNQNYSSLIYVFKPIGE